MSTLTVQVPESLRKSLQTLAEREGVSIDHFVSSSIAEKILVLLTEKYLAERARHGSRDKYLQTLAEVPDTPPDERDELYRQQ